MHDNNSESGTKADIEKRNESYNAYVKNVTPKGRPALVKPMKSGIEEHEQNGVTVPSKAAAIFAPTP